MFTFRFGVRRLRAEFVSLGVSLRTTLMLAVLATFTASLSAQIDNSAQIRGRVTDAVGAALPGAQVSVTGRGLSVPRETVADDDGRFTIAGLQPSPATYTVSARLAGFERATVMVRAHEGADGSFTIRLHLDCYEPDIEVPPELGPLVAAADLIALVRLDSIERGRQARIGDGWCGPVTIFRGTIIEAVKDRRPQRSPSVRFVLPGQTGQFKRGDNYIVIVQWQSAIRAYQVTSRSYFALVRDGRLTEGEGKPIADVLSGLRSMSQP